MTVRVLCLGNEWAGDDSVGIRLGRALQAMPLPPGVCVELRQRVDFDLLENVLTDDKLILVDAMRIGQPIGACQILDASDAALQTPAPFCSHTLGLTQVLQVAAKLFPAQVPRKITVMGIEVGMLDHYGGTLSPAVDRALPQAIKTVLGLVGVDDWPGDRQH